MAGIHATVPVLASLDLAESRQFYTELLGFDCLHASADYLMLRRDGCELAPVALHRAPHRRKHLVLRAGRHRRPARRLCATGLLVEPRSPWGMREFHVIDPTATCSSLAKTELSPPTTAPPFAP